MLTGKQAIISLCVVTAMVLTVAAGYMVIGKDDKENNSGIIFKNHNKVVQTVRTGLREHSKEITITFRAKKKHMDGIELMVSEIMDEALVETERADEGDYIRYQYGGYKIRYSNNKDKKGYLYMVKIIPEYYTYLAEEEWVTKEVGKIIEDMNFTKKTSDYDKISNIYEYVCNNVSYDSVHKNKDEKHMKTTAFAALKYRTAVCQGYAVLLYRLLKEAGINARVVTGTLTYNGVEEFHAWNLVCADGNYYNLDATMGRAHGEENYFLKSDETFNKDHKRDEKFITDTFFEDYPMSEYDYDLKIKR